MTKESAQKAKQSFSQSKSSLSRKTQIDKLITCYYLCQMKLQEEQDMILKRLFDKTEEQVDEITQKVYGDMLSTCWHDLPTLKSSQFIQLIMDPQSLKERIPMNLFEKYIDFDFQNILNDGDFKLTKQESQLLKQADVLHKKFSFSMDQLESALKENMTEPLFGLANKLMYGDKKVVFYACIELILVLFIAYRVFKCFDYFSGDKGEELKEIQKKIRQIKLKKYKKDKLDLNYTIPKKQQEKSEKKIQ